jgi:cobalt-zinc-cadmium efflux system outer membrane protein
LGTAAAAHAEKSVVTLDQAVALALQHNPSLRAQELAVASARAGETTARLRPNPILSNETADLTAMVTQLMELGGKRARRMDSARLATEIAHRDLADARRTLLLTVRATFAAGLLAQSNLALAQENLENFRRVEELNRLRFEAGEIARSELLKVQLQKLQFAGDVQDATLALATAKAALRALVSTPSLPEDFDLEGNQSVPEDDRSLEALKAQALAGRPDLRAAETTLQKAQADWRLARANRTPDLSLVVGWQHSGSSVGPSWFQPFYGKGPVSNTLGFGLSFPLRLFDRYQGEIARTRVEIDRATALAQSARDQVLSDVETAYAAMRVSKQRVALYEATYLSAAKESREIAEFAYQKGGASTIELLDAERTYRATLIAYQQAKSAYLSSVFQVEAAVGSDSPR